MIESPSFAPTYSEILASSGDFKGALPTIPSKPLKSSDDPETEKVLKALALQQYQLVATTSAIFVPCSSIVGGNMPNEPITGLSMDQILNGDPTEFYSRVDEKSANRILPQKFMKTQDDPELKRAVAANIILADYLGQSAVKTGQTANSVADHFEISGIQIPSAPTPESVSILIPNAVGPQDPKIESVSGVVQLPTPPSPAVKTMNSPEVSSAIGYSIVYTHLSLLTLYPILKFAQDTLSGYMSFSFNKVRFK